MLLRFVALFRTAALAACLLLPPMAAAESQTTTAAKNQDHAPRKPFSGYLSPNLPPPRIVPPPEASQIVPPSPAGKLVLYVPIGRFCGPRAKTVEDWAQEVPVIFIGKAEERKSTLPPQGELGNHCWVRFTVDEGLKGDATRPTLWLKASYNTTNADGSEKEDISNLRYCPFTEGRSYVVFTYRKVTTSSKQLLFLSGHSDNERLHCMPIVSSEPAIIDRIRSTIQQGESQDGSKVHHRSGN